MVKLSKLSKNYLQFFESKIKPEKSLHLKKLYDTLDKYYKNSSIPTKITEKKVNFQIQESYFLPKEIKQSIYELTHFHVVKLQIKKTLVTLHVYHNSDINISNFVEIITTYIKYIYSIQPPKKDLKITYYLTDTKKTIHQTIPTQTNIQSGYYNKHNEIVIFRREEVYKTTLHELLRFVKLDGENQDYMKSYYENRYQKQLLKFDTREAICDFWAILLNLFLTTKLLKKSYHFFRLLVSLEKLFVLYQAKKMISLSKQLNKYTDVMNYFIVKGELFQNLPKALKYVNSNMKHSSRLYENLDTFKPIVVDEPIHDSTARMTMIELV